MVTLPVELLAYLDRRAHAIAEVSAVVIFEPRRWNPRTSMISARS